MKAWGKYYKSLAQIDWGRVLVSMRGQKQDWQVLHATFIFANVSNQ